MSDRKGVLWTLLVGAAAVVLAFLVPWNAEGWDRWRDGLS